MSESFLYYIYIVPVLCIDLSDLTLLCSYKNIISLFALQNIYDKCHFLRFKFILYFFFHLYFAYILLAFSPILTEVREITTSDDVINDL